MVADVFVSDHKRHCRYSAVRAWFVSGPGPFSNKAGLASCSLDCAQVYGLLHETRELVDGFAVIESNGELDEVAVYAAASREKWRHCKPHVHRSARFDGSARLFVASALLEGRLLMTECLVP